MDGSVLFNQI